MATELTRPHSTRLSTLVAMTLNPSREPEDRVKAAVAVIEEAALSSITSVVAFFTAGEPGMLIREKTFNVLCDALSIVEGLREVAAQPEAA